jgi:D-3-phosphoglycerate dehydrogenase / 2-oxoglutarate reductase
MISSGPVKVLLLENIHPLATELLRKAGGEVTSLAGSLEENELIKHLKGVQVLGIRSKTNISKTVIESSPDLMAIGAFCIGVNQIDIHAANACGVPVFNAPYSNTRSVAELVICEMIALSRGLGDRNSMAHRGEWDKSARGAKEVRGKTLGIVGYGHIGSQVSVLAEALGLKVVFFDIVKKLTLGNSKQVDRLEDLLHISDFVSLHVPETSQTIGMFSKTQFKAMKAGSYLINASRGTVVIIPDLVETLKSGHLAGAAIDVFPIEPSNNKETFKSELQGISNVLLTPHIGGSTEEAQEAIGREVADSIAGYVRKGATTGSVNFPQLDMEVKDGAHRVLNVHQNVPGVLRDINKIVSDLGANIKAQSLATDAQIGYLIMDMEKTDAKDASEHIARLSTSIKTRLLY